MLRGVLLCLEKKNRRVHVRGAKVRRDNVGRRTKVNVPINNKLTFNSGRIVRIVRRIIYVCVATVDGRSLACLCISVLVFAQNGKRFLQGVWSMYAFMYVSMPTERLL